MIDSQATTLIAAWREDATTARKTGHEQTAREIEAADLFEKQAAELKTLRENNTALQAECDEMNAELHDMRVASSEGRDALDIIHDGQQKFAMRKAGAELEATHLHLQQAIKERDELAAHCRELSKTWLALDDCEEESAEAGEHTTKMRNLVLDNQELSSGHSLARRDAITAAEATRHAASLVRTLDVISLDELAATLDEVADMQEASDHGDAE